MCAALQLGGDVEQPWLMSKYNVITKTERTLGIITPPEEDRAMAIGNMHKKFGEDRTCSSEDMIAGRQTDRQARSSQYSAPLSGRSNNRCSFLWFAESAQLGTESRCRPRACDVLLLGNQTAS